MQAIVVATEQDANDLIARLDAALGYPKNDTDHAAAWIRHYADGSVPDDQQPYGVEVDDDCTAAAAQWPEVPAPVTLDASWWKPR